MTSGDPTQIAARRKPSGPREKNRCSTDNARRLGGLACFVVLTTLSVNHLTAADKPMPNSQQAPAVRFDPIHRKIEGWTVHVDPALVEGESREEGERTLVMLANHLQRVKILIPDKTLPKLQTIEIWIERSHPTLKAMQYHPGKQWLVDHGHDPRLTRKVHIPQAHQLLSRQQMLKHPAVILHELAHAYHDQILGFEHPEIVKAFEAAKDRGNYENVLLFTGKTVRHYGLTNHKEYFAEGTEAYFYRNDFFPFVAAELKQHDRVLHDVLRNVWGDGD